MGPFQGHLEELHWTDVASQCGRPSSSKSKFSTVFRMEACQKIDILFFLAQLRDGSNITTISLFAFSSLFQAKRANSQKCLGNVIDYGLKNFDEKFVKLQFAFGDFRLYFSNSFTLEKIREITTEDNLE